jgi:hypothetical protein
LQLHTVHFCARAQRLLRNLRFWAAASLMAGVLAGCGGGSGNKAVAPLSAKADTTAQALTVGSAMTSFSPLAPAGGTPPYIYTIVTGSLPAGLTLDAGTGTVSGTPTAIYGTSQVTFQVQDAANKVAATNSTVRFTVGQASNYISAIASTTAQSLTVGTAMTSFSPLTPSGGATPYTYTVRSGSLPAGLVLDSVTGAITGTPSAAYAAADVTFGVVDANFAIASTTSTVRFTVAPLPAGYLYAAGLTWMPITTYYDLSTAITYCSSTTINGTNDWRLPTPDELVALYNLYPNNSAYLHSLGWATDSTWTSAPQTPSANNYYVSLYDGTVSFWPIGSVLLTACVR